MCVHLQNGGSESNGGSGRCSSPATSTSLPPPAQDEQYAPLIVLPFAIGNGGGGFKNMAGNT